MPLLTSASYPSVRAALDIALDSEALPDSIIGLDIYLGAGMRDVIVIDPLAETRTGSELQHAQTAAVLFTAARLIGALPQIKSETRDTHAYTRQEVNVAARAAELRALAGAELDAYLDPGDATSDRPTVFAAGCGRRGRW